MLLRIQHFTVALTFEVSKELGNYSSTRSIILPWTKRIPVIGIHGIQLIH